MSHRLAIILLMLAMAGCVKPKQELITPTLWYRATQKECDAESQRELAAMGKMGITGDPPISMGYYESNGTTAYSETPCGYTNGSGEFITRYLKIVRGKETEITKKEFDRRTDER